MTQATNDEWLHHLNEDEIRSSLLALEEQVKGRPQV